MIVCIAAIICLGFALTAKTQSARIRPAGAQSAKTLEERVAILEKDMELVERLIVEFSGQLALVGKKVRVIEDKIR